MIQNENVIMQSGYKENFIFYEIFWLRSQILDFTLWLKNTVVEFSKDQFHRIETRSVLKPLYVYLSFGILQIRLPIHDGQTPPGPNRALYLD